MNSVTTAARALPRAGTAVPNEVKEPPMGKGGVFWRVWVVKY